MYPQNGGEVDEDGDDDDQVQVVTEYEGRNYLEFEANDIDSSFREITSKLSKFKPKKYE